MAELTPLDEKLAEVLGLAQAAQSLTDTVAKMEDGEKFADDLARMRDEAADTEQRTLAYIETLEGRKTKIQDLARETKGEANEMAKAYLGDEDEALDGFEFMSMAEAGELCHWEIVERIAEDAGETEALELARHVLPIQRGHVGTVREAYLALAAEEAEEMASA